MARCTILSLFGLQEWFDKRFLELCLAHDEAYVRRVWREKVVADFALAHGFAAKGYASLGYLSLLYTSTLGTPFWLYHGWRQGAW